HTHALAGAEGRPRFQQRDPPNGFSKPANAGMQPNPNRIRVPVSEQIETVVPASSPIYPVTATPLTGRKGPVPKRRYQEGLFKKENGHYYSPSGRPGCAWLAP